jgi:7,8-dihydropterin-6-yl-methyl-4-(beta-D-ribofuranosyl)aminobenzene 5'-phosphate synthase
MKIIIYAALVVLTACQIKTSDEKSKIQQKQIEHRTINDNSIINMYDAFGKKKAGLVKDFGFSAILKYNGKIILFDSGSNANIFKQNVNTLGIDLRQVDIAVASHSHFDHISGFDYLLEVNPDVKIYFPFDIYWGANFPFNISGVDPEIADSLPKEMQYFNGNFKNYNFNQSGRFWKANVNYIKESQEIAPGINLITTSSSNMGNFIKHPLSTCKETDVDCDEHWKKAKIIKLPELTLSLETSEGDVIIVGCSHSLVEKIIQETQSFTNNNTALVYGGYHLLPYEETDISRLVLKMKNEMNIKKVAPAHCTGHLAFKILKDHYQENYLFAGLGEELIFNP